MGDLLLYNPEKYAEYLQHKISLEEFVRYCVIVTNVSVE